MTARSGDQRTLCFANVYIFIYFFLGSEDAALYFRQICTVWLRCVFDNTLAFLEILMG